MTDERPGGGLTWGQMNASAPSPSAAPNPPVPSVEGGDDHPREQAILGLIASDLTRLAAALDLPPDKFNHHRHRHIFKLLRSASNERAQRLEIEGEHLVLVGADGARKNIEASNCYTARLLREHGRQAGDPNAYEMVADIAERMTCANRRTVVKQDVEAASVPADDVPGAHRLQWISTINLSPKYSRLAVRVAGALCYPLTDKKTAATFATVETIAKLVDTDVRTVLKIFAEFRKDGFLRLIARAAPKRPARYQLTLPRQSAKQAPAPRPRKRVLTPRTSEARPTP